MELKLWLKIVQLFVNNVLIVLYGIETWAAHIYRIGTAVLIVLYGIETIPAVVLPRVARVLIVLYGIETCKVTGFYTIKQVVNLSLWNLNIKVPSY